MTTFVPPVPLPTQNWGGGRYGADPFSGTNSGQGWGNNWGNAWGGPSSTAVMQGAIATAENVVRLYFSNVPYYSGILDAGDASNPANFSVAVVPGTQGSDGQPARPVGVLQVTVGEDPNSLDVYLDRPMSPTPAQYIVTTSGTLAGETAPQNALFNGCYRVLVPPSMDAATPSTDIANPQTFAALLTTPNVASSSSLGSLVYDASGDYATDQGLVSLKKRILRRGMSKRGGYAHLPGYGEGIPDHGKKLSSPSERARIAASYQAGIKQEPEVVAASVQAVTPPATPQICYFVIKVRTKGGKTAKFQIPFSVG